MLYVLCRTTLTDVPVVLLLSGTGGREATVQGKDIFYDTIVCQLKQKPLKITETTIKQNKKYIDVAGMCLHIIASSDREATAKTKCKTKNKATKS